MGMGVPNGSNLILDAVGPHPESVRFELELLEVVLMCCNILKRSFLLEVSNFSNWKLTAVGIAWILRALHCSNMAQEGSHWSWSN